jgi:hypothetical protein
MTGVCCRAPISGIGFSTSDETLILDPHPGSPSRNHSKREDEEHTSRLARREEVRRVIAQQQPQGDEPQENGNERVRSTHHDGVFVQRKSRRPNQRQGQQQGPGGERTRGPRPCHAEFGHEKHAEAGAHA